MALIADAGSMVRLLVALALPVGKMVYRITPASSHEFGLRPDRRKNVRFRIRTMMIAAVIVSLVTALVVLGWRAREEIRRAHVELEVAKTPQLWPRR